MEWLVVCQIHGEGAVLVTFQLNSLCSPCSDSNVPVALPPNLLSPIDLELIEMDEDQHVRHPSLSNVLEDGKYAALFDIM